MLACPFFGDQFFWSATLEKSAAGVASPFAKLTPKKLLEALQKVRGEACVAAAAALAKEMRKESDGLTAAVDAFHSALPLDSMRCDVI